MIGWHPDRLVAARESIAMTQAELARRCRCAPSAISHWETGKRAPDCANLAKLAVALGVTSDYLLGLADEIRWHPSALADIDRDAAEIDRRLGFTENV